MKRNNYCIKDHESLHDLIYLNAIKTMEKALREAKPGLRRHEEAYDELKRLEGMGLANSLNVESLREDAAKHQAYLKALKRLGFMREVWCWLGEGTFILEPDFFKAMLERKGLGCERLSCFKGRLCDRMLKEYSAAERNCRDEYGSGNRYMGKFATNHCEGLQLPFIEEGTEEIGWLPPEEGFLIAYRKQDERDDSETDGDVIIFSYSDEDSILIHFYQSGGGRTNKNIAKRYKELQNQII